MSKYRLQILQIIPVTHNVRSYRIEKPAGFSFVPGQATDLSIDLPGWEQELRPFTFTCLPGDAYLEFTIKSYNDHEGVTNKLGTLHTGDYVQISDPWGAISYHGEGIFIAGGAGITPFLAILRDLDQQGKIGNNRLFFANKTEGDIIYHHELEKMLGKNFINLISAQENSQFEKARINKAWLQNHVKDFSVPFYVCGPDAFTKDILNALEESGANPEALVFEK